MKIHEYQAKQILARYGVRIPRGEIAHTKDEARRAAEKLGGTVVVKAQIHAGGRGKGGGVKVAKTADQAEQLAEQMLGMTLVTHQTGPEGRKVQKVYIEEGLDIRRELYLGIVVDRQTGKVVFMASAAAAGSKSRRRIRKPSCAVHYSRTWTSALPGRSSRSVWACLGLVIDAAQFMMALYRAFEDTDASLAEINPFLVTGTKVYALDAKMNFDDNALYRHKDIKELRDLNEEGLSRSKRAGSDSTTSSSGGIACMVNGAGLAMATMDIIKLAGGSWREFSRYRWRSFRTAGRERLPHSFVGPECPGSSYQYLWRNHALRCRGFGSCSGGAEHRRQGSHCRSTGRNECRTGAGNPAHIGAQLHCCGWNEGRCR